MRKINSLRNFLTTFFTMMILALLGFVKIDAFLNNLGEELYAINQLFFQIFSYLSIAEAGIGAIIVQRYYKLLVNNEKEDICVAHTTAMKFLRQISTGMFIVGVVVSFFLNFLTNNSLSLGYMQIVFIIFMIRNLVDYTMYTPRFLIQADQKSYKINTWVNSYRIFELLIEVGLLYLKIDYMYILLPTIFTRIIMNYIVNKVVYKEYPWLKTTPNTDKSILKGTKYLIGHRIAAIISNNTDILIISSFLKPLQVAIYGSYNYIIKFANDIVNMILNALLASFGNVMNMDNKNMHKQVFEEMNSMFIFLAGLLSIFLGVFLTKFVYLWLGKDMLMATGAFMCLIIILFQNISRVMLNATRDVKGWFKETQVYAYTEGTIKIILSIILVKRFGLLGVLLATVSANFIINIWTYPVYTYKTLFNSTPRNYYLKYFFNFILAAVIIFLSNNIIGNIDITNYFKLAIIIAIYMIIVSVLVTIINMILFKSFRSLVKKLLELGKEIIKKKRDNDESINTNSNI